MNFVSATCSETKRKLAVNLSLVSVMCRVSDEMNQETTEITFSPDETMISQLYVEETISQLMEQVRK